MNFDFNIKKGEAGILARKIFFTKQ